MFATDSTSCEATFELYDDASVARFEEYVMALDESMPESPLDAARMLTPEVDVVRAPGRHMSCWGSHDERQLCRRLCGCVATSSGST